MGLISGKNETFSRIYEAAAALTVSFLARIITGESCQSRVNGSVSVHGCVCVRRAHASVHGCVCVEGAYVSM